MSESETVSCQIIEDSFYFVPLNMLNDDYKLIVYMYDCNINKQ